MSSRSSHREDLQALELDEQGESGALQIGIGKLEIGFLPTNRLVIMAHQIEQVATAMVYRSRDSLRIEPSASD